MHTVTKFIECFKWAFILLGNIYFRLRFGLVNAISDYLRLNIRVVCLGNFNPYVKCLLIEFVIPNLRRIYFSVPDIFKQSLKPVFEYEITF